MGRSTSKPVKSRASKNKAPASKKTLPKRAAAKSAPSWRAAKLATKATTRGAAAAAHGRAKKTGTKPVVRKTTAAVRKRLIAFSKSLVVNSLDKAQPRWTETLRDGTHVIIRPIDKRDAALERDFIKRLSPDSRRMRFLGQMSEPSESLIRSLTDIDYQRDVAFIALVHRDNKTQEIGVSRYSIGGNGEFCECAVTVSDEWHHKGLATLLMRHLISVARTRGIRRMVSFDAIDNVEMRQLAATLGFKRKADPDDSTLVVHTLML